MLNRRDLIWGAATSVGALTVTSSEIVEAAPEPTMSLNVIYPNHDGARFDTGYYRSTHIPLAMKVMKAASVILIEGDKIVGETPRLAPGEQFSYNSYHVTGCDASAHGSFHGVDEQGNRVHVILPPFEMHIPRG